MRGIFLTIFIAFFIATPLFSLNAKDLEIHGVNFEKKYDNIFDKLYFHFFVKEKSASISDIAYVLKSDFVMCRNASIDWKHDICDEYSPAIQEYKEFQEQWLTKKQLKPYVIYSPDKNFNKYILWIDSDSGRIMRLIARADKYSGNNSGELCKEAIKFWFNKILKENEINTQSNILLDNVFYSKPWIRIRNYILEYQCFGGTSLLIVEHDDYKGIMREERKKLELNIQ